MWGCVYVPGSVHAQERLRRRSASFLTGLGALYMQEVKAKAERSTLWLSVEDMPNIHIEPFGKDWETYRFLAFKKYLSNH